jgi:soluble lytic murein transglycosylase-like protein
MMKAYFKQFTIFALFILGFILPVSAQKPSRAAETQSIAATNLANATKEYKDSLGVLVSTYETSAAQADKKLSQMKGLFDDGLISKREYDLAVAQAAEAHGKVDVARSQITAADGMLVQAQKSLEPLSGGTIVGGGNRDIKWTTGNARYDSLIRENGARFGVDPYLIYCVMQQESHFNPTASSPKGAQGLMQLMPDTAARFGVVSILDPAQSIAGGTRYLKQLLQMFGGRVDLALASYNAGEGAVLKYGGKIPPFKETVAYVRAIGARYGIQGN